MFIAVSHATTYIINSDYCALKFNTFKHSFTVGENCFTKNDGYSQGFLVTCMTEQEYQNPRNVLEVHFIFKKNLQNKPDLTYATQKDGHPIEYNLFDFATDINNGGFKSCKVEHFMSITEERNNNEDDWDHR